MFLTRLFDMFAATQNYIPGLNKRPVTPPSEEIPASLIPKEVEIY